MSHVLEEFIKIEKRIKLIESKGKKVSKELESLWAHAESSLSLYLHKTHIAEDLPLSNVSFLGLRKIICDLECIQRSSHLQEHLELFEYQAHLFRIQELIHWIDSNAIA